MPYITDHQQKFADLDLYIKNQNQLKRQANGGNSILFSYEPKEEHHYILKARELYADTFEFIDISDLLVSFIDEDGWDFFEEYYSDFQNTPHVVFKSDDPSQDLFDRIIRSIKDARNDGKIPCLIRSGCLNGTGIENVNIMENKEVMATSDPLVIFYPATIENENIYFLNFKPASKYRCTLVK